MTVGIILLFVGVTIAQDTEKSQSPRGDLLYVGGSGPRNYTKIQDAIDNASEGDTVFVFNGIYYENLVIREPWYLTINGENMWNTIIDGKGRDFVIRIETYYITITNFTIQNTSGSLSICSGLQIFGGAHLITNNYIISNPRSGILIYGGNVTISENIIEKNGDGICLHTISLVKIINNTIEKNSNGIFFESQGSCNNIISNNLISENVYGIFASEYSKSNNNKILNNAIFNNTRHGIFLQSNECFHNLIEGNQIFSNGYCGIFFTRMMGHRGFLLNRINGNEIYSNGQDGINIESSLYSTIEENNISSNGHSGMFFHDSKYSILKKNIVYNDTVLLENCYKMSVIRNDFLNCENGPAAFSNSLRTRWFNNYWGVAVIHPKAINGNFEYCYGGYIGTIIIPWINFDLFPALKPYNIGGN